MVAQNHRHEFFKRIFLINILNGIVNLFLYYLITKSTTFYLNTIQVKIIHNAVLIKSRFFFAVSEQASQHFYCDVLVHGTETEYPIFKLPCEPLFFFKKEAICLIDTDFWHRNGSCDSPALKKCVDWNSYYADFFPSSRRIWVFFKQGGDFCVKFVIWINEFNHFTFSLFL